MDVLSIMHRGLAIGKWALPKGIHFITMKVDHFSQTRKILVEDI